MGPFSPLNLLLFVGFASLVEAQTLKEPALIDLRSFPFTPARGADGTSFEPKLAWAVVAHPDGRFLILDAKGEAVSVFDRQGRFVRHLGGSGRGPGNFVLPAAAAITGDTVLIWDLAQRRMSWYALDGAHLRDRVFPQFGAVQKLRLHPSGGMVLQVGPIYRFPPDSLNGVGQLFLADLDTGAQRELARWRDTTANVSSVTPTSSAVAAVPFGPHSSWEVAASGAILLANGADYVIKEIGEAGPGPGYRRLYRVVPLTSRERDSAERTVRTYEPHLRSQAVIPRTKPAIEDLRVSEDGCLWVQTSGSAALSGQQWDVFDSRRSWISSVLLPAGARLMQVTRNRLYVVRRDSLDLETVGILNHSAECRSP